MKVVFLNTHDLKGGAAIAAYQLLKALQLKPIPEMLVLERSSSDPAVKKVPVLAAVLRKYIELLPLLLYPKRKGFGFSLANVPDTIPTHVRKRYPDLVHIHWINRGFLSVASLKKLPQPLVWTLHDMWPLTGGCHYSRDCLRFTRQCGACPYLGSKKVTDISFKQLAKKKKILKNMPITFVAPSKWIAAMAQKSSIYNPNKHKIVIINHGLDISKFPVISQKTARQHLTIPLSATVILFGAQKGMRNPDKHFPEFLAQVKEQRQVFAKDLQIIVFGEKKTQKYVQEDITIHAFAQTSDKKFLAGLYAAADVTVMPSLQEVFGQVAAESLCCGTPVVGFKDTGVADIVTNSAEGALVAHGDFSAFAKAVTKVLIEQTKQKRTRTRIKNIRSRFDINQVQKKYIALYKSLVA